MRFGTHPKCWSCEHFVNKSTLFCSTCQKVQPLSPNDNYFGLLGVPQTFDVDLRTLEKHFWALQRRVHPDNFTLKSKQEQSLSLDASSALNMAYKTLKSPEERAKYLLKLEGIDVGEETKVDDPEFLMEILELRTQVDETNDEKQIKHLLEDNKKKLDVLFGQFRAALAQRDLNAAKQTLVYVQYYARIDEELKKKL